MIESIQELLQKEAQAVLNIQHSLCFLLQEFLNRLNLFKNSCKRKHKLC